MGRDGLASGPTIPSFIPDISTKAFFSLAFMASS
jgi:hypothetical protein